MQAPESHTNTIHRSGKTTSSENTHSDYTRRRFIKQSVAVTGSLAAMPSTSLAKGVRSNEKIVVGVIGPGGMGLSHIRKLAPHKEIHIAAVCDADEHRMARASQLAEELSGHSPKQFRDMRQVLEMKDVDAVFIATPDHWHAPATLLACEAGKHVYVEKPCSHNVREGRLMVEAARKHNRVVQVGTQSRSTAHVRKAVEMLRGGAIGEILTAKVWNSQRRSSIGKSKPGKAPDHLDFDLWLGPAPEVPYRSNMLPGIWRWWYDFGTGDMGNDGVHDLDIGRWGLGVNTHPKKITALGGKYYFDDDQQFPDTQNVLFEYAPDPETGRPRQLSFEQRIWSPYVQEGFENGNAFYGTNGLMLLGKHGGWKLYGPRNELREEMKGSPNLEAHHQDFFDSIRSGRAPKADIEQGHLSSSLCHLGNLATRLGRLLHFDPNTERFLNDSEADGMLTRNYRDHWAAPKG